MKSRLAPFAFALSVLILTGLAAAAPPARAVETLQKADMLKLRLDLAAFAARSRSTGLDARLKPGQTATLKQLGVAFGKTGDAAALSRGWQRYVAVNKPAEPDVNALIQWVLRESYLQSATDLKAQVDKVKRINAQKSKLSRPAGKPGDEAKLANVSLQDAIQKQQQMMHTISNVSKQMHDSAIAIIRKIGG
ncbi:MAG: hypothetical protein ABI399_08915 [Bauldia sp.]